MTMQFMSKSAPTPIVHQYLQNVEQCTCSMAYWVQPGDVSSAIIQSVQVGPITISRHKGSGAQSCERTRRHITDSFADFFILCMPQRSQFNLRCAGRAAIVPSDTFFFLSTATPFSADVRGHPSNGQFDGLYMRIPASLIRSKMPRFDEVCGQFFSMRQGISHYTYSTMNTLVHDGPFLSHIERSSVANMLLDMIFSMGTLELGNLPTGADEKSTVSETLAKAKRFVDSNLSDPDLTAKSVAKHCHISVRYLQGIFASEEFSLGRYIREQRLQHCFQGLHDPALVGKQVMAIAEKWGFKNAAHFSRAFKKRFGYPPSKNRRDGARSESIDSIIKKAGSRKGS